MTTAALSGPTEPYSDQWSDSILLPAGNPHPKNNPNNGPLSLSWPFSYLLYPSKWTAQFDIEYLYEPYSDQQIPQALQVQSLTSSYSILLPAGDPSKWTAQKFDIEYLNEPYSDQQILKAQVLQ